MIEFEQVAVPLLQDDGTFLATIPFFIEHHASDVGIRSLTALLMMSPKGVTWRLTIRRSGGREIEVAGEDPRAVEDVATSVVVKIREMGDLLAMAENKERVLLLEPISNESDWIYEPPEA